MARRPPTPPSLRRLARWLPLGALALALAPAAGAFPLLSVDLDPAASGVQPFRSVGLDETPAIDLRIFGVEASDPIDGFTLELGFDPARVEVTGVTEGSFFGSTTAPSDSLAPPEAVLSRESTSGPASGSGVLLGLELSPRGPGDALLDLNDVLLPGASGAPILNDAVLRVVPEPGTAALLLVGCAGLAAAGRRRAPARSGGRPRTA